MANIVEHETEKIITVVAVVGIGLYFLPQIIEALGKGVGNAAVNLGSAVTDKVIGIANGIVASIGDTIYDATHNQTYTLPQSATEARLMIADQPYSFPMSEVVNAVNNLDAQGITLADSRMRKVLPFILNNPNFFEAAQVQAATAALTGYSP